MQGPCSSGPWPASAPGLSPDVLSCRSLNVQWCSIHPTPLHKCTGPQFLENVPPFLPYYLFKEQLFPLLLTAYWPLGLSSDFYLHTHIHLLSLEHATHTTVVALITERGWNYVNSTLLAARKHDFIQHTTTIYLECLLCTVLGYRRRTKQAWMALPHGSYSICSLHSKFAYSVMQTNICLFDFCLLLESDPSITHCHRLSLQDLLSSTDWVGKMHLKPNSACLRHTMNSKF